MGIEKITGFVMKNSLTLPSLANKSLNSLRDENVNLYRLILILFMRDLVRNSIKGVHVMLLFIIVNLNFVMRFLILFQKN